MKSVNTHINLFSSPSPLASVGKRLSSFVEQNAGVFQALTRHGLPHGGNWLSDSEPDTLPKMELTAETMVEVERELDDIILRLSQLSSSLENGQSAGASRNMPGAGNRPTEIGIERFRSLQLDA